MESSGTSVTQTTPRSSTLHWHRAKQPQSASLLTIGPEPMESISAPLTSLCGLGMSTSSERWILVREMAMVG